MSFICCLFPLPYILLGHGHGLLVCVKETKRGLTPAKETIFTLYMVIACSNAFGHSPSPMFFLFLFWWPCTFGCTSTSRYEKNNVAIANQMLLHTTLTDWTIHQNNYWEHLFACHSDRIACPVCLYIICNLFCHSFHSIWFLLLWACGAEDSAAVQQ